MCKLAGDNKLTNDVEAAIAEHLAHAVRNKALEAGNVCVLLSRLHCHDSLPIRKRVLVGIWNMTKHFTTYWPQRHIYTVSLVAYI